MLETRKSLRDKNGNFTLYVVECKLSSGAWIPNWHGGYLAVHSMSEALKNKNKLYELLNKINPAHWTRENIRVVLYKRAEG